MLCLLSRMSAVSGRVCTRVGSALKIRYVVYSALLREDAVEALDLLEDGGELLGGSTVRKPGRKPRSPGANRTPPISEAVTQRRKLFVGVVPLFVGHRLHL